MGLACSLLRGPAMPAPDRKRQPPQKRRPQPHAPRHRRKGRPALGDHRVGGPDKAKATADRITRPRSSNVGSLFAELQTLVAAADPANDDRITDLYTRIHSRMTARVATAETVATQSIAAAGEAMGRMNLVTPAHERATRTKTLIELVAFRAAVRTHLKDILPRFDPANGGKTGTTFAKNASTTLHESVYNTHYRRLILTNELSRIIEHKGTIGLHGAGQNKIVEEAAYEAKDLLLQMAKMVASKALQHSVLGGAVPPAVADLVASMAIDLVDELVAKQLIQQLNFDVGPLVDRLIDSLVQSLLDAVIGACTGWARDELTGGLGTGKADQIAAGLVRVVGVDLPVALIDSAVRDLLAGKDPRAVFEAVFTREIFEKLLPTLLLGDFVDQKTSTRKGPSNEL